MSETDALADRDDDAVEYDGPAGSKIPIANW
jgi:hypothetical protein